MCQYCSLATTLGVQVAHESPAQKFIQEAEEQERGFSVQALKGLLADRPALAQVGTPYQGSDFAGCWSD